MRINHILKAVPAFAIGLALAACSKPYEYTPAEPEDASKTYVSADFSAPRDIDADGSDILIPFIRSNASGDLEANVTIEDPSGLFSLKESTIRFVDGETKAYAKVAYSYDALDASTKYTIYLTMGSSEYASEYRLVTIPVTCSKAWQDLGTAQFYEDWWVGKVGERKLLKAPDGSETYRVVEPWSKADLEAEGYGIGDVLPYFEFSVAEDGSITYKDVINLGFTFSNLSCHMLFPAKVSGFEDLVAENVMLNSKLAQIAWVPVLNVTPSGAIIKARNQK